MLPLSQRGSRPLSRRRQVRPLEQLSLELGPDRPRWVYSRLVTGSPHFRRIRERTEFVRYFFPELDGITIRVGLALKRGVLGWGSLDPESPGIWVRPRRLEYFTIAHELTHLLQARMLVPRGERQCDLWALTRSPMLIDTVPSYLRLPRGLRLKPMSAVLASHLCEAARRAIAAREAGERNYLKRFESELRGLSLRALMGIVA
ncbi:MAG TPA: hypothetical protein VMJ70_16175 [Candidatus Sulfotelmatobacter sp.]|nr:hypothetical protein [Candidatus Sulfotelmatobacter sp.]